MRRLSKHESDRNSRRDLATTPIEAVRERATEASAEKRSRRKEERKQAVEDADYSLTQRLRLAVADRRGEIVQALIDHAVSNPNAQSMAILWDRDQGRVAEVIEQVETTYSVEDMMRDLRALPETDA